MAGGTPLGQMYIELGLDVSKFNPTLNGAKNAVKYFQSNVKALDSSLKNNGKNTDLLQAKYKTLGQAIEAQRKVLDQMKKVSILSNLVRLNLIRPLLRLNVRMLSW